LLARDGGTIFVKLPSGVKKKTNSWRVKTVSVESEKRESEKRQVNPQHRKTNLALGREKGQRKKKKRRALFPRVPRIGRFWSKKS